MRPVTAPTERGTVTVLVVGFVVVVAMLVAVVVDASAAYLQRQAMHSLADGAALAAADGAQGEQVYTSGLGEQAQIDPTAARTQVAAYLSATGAAAEHPGLRWQVSSDGTVVSVRVSAPLDLPISPEGWQQSTTVSGAASAVVDIG
ncbi:hypothetical protein BH20ACT6_BH20ACT6_16160 [soil metagenome]